jgi:group I intron endonuclease
MIGIYKITNPNGRIYIGQTTNHVVRWKKYEKLQCKDQPSLYSSLKKYGWENHTCEIIEECSAEHLDEREIFWGEYYNVLSNQHLNNRLGRGHGSYDSEETKLKKSLCHKGRSNYWLHGKSLSKDHAQKISQAKKGHKCYENPERRKKISKTKTGKPNLLSFEGLDRLIKAKSKPVLQYSLDGIFIKEWNSGKEAAISLNIYQPNINSCCNGKVPKYKGFVWKFKN